VLKQAIEATDSSLVYQRLKFCSLNQFNYKVLPLKRWYTADSVATLRRSCISRKI